MKGDYFTGMTQRPDHRADRLLAVNALHLERLANFRINPTDPMNIIGIPKSELNVTDLRIVEKTRNISAKCTTKA